MIRFGSLTRVYLPLEAKVEGRRFVIVDSGSDLIIPGPVSGNARSIFG